MPSKIGDGLVMTTSTTGHIKMNMYGEGLFLVQNNFSHLITILTKKDLTYT